MKGILGFFRNNPLTGTLLVLTLVTLGFIWSAAHAQSPTTAEIQSWLEEPVVLYGLMMLGSLISGVKQMSVGKMSGSPVTFTQYLSHWPEMFVTLGTNTLAFVGLIYMDQLNFVSAVSIGYALNSLSDLLPQGTRSDTVANHQ